MKAMNEIKERVTGSISVKIMIIGLLILILLIPASMIKNLIIERQSARDGVVREISDKWGNAQNITGPILNIPWNKYVDITKDGKIQIEKIEKNLFILPETLDIQGDLQPEIRYRGVYKVIVYESKLKIKGSFIIPDSLELGINNENINWEKANIQIGIPDMRGIQNNLKINWNDESYAVSPGLLNKAVGRSGVTAIVPVTDDKHKYYFEFTLDLNGSENLFFTPLGKTTDVHLSSTWNTPSFTGAFLPDDRKISDNGFTADWKILHLNRNFPQIWKEQMFSIKQSSFGVNLLFPVDEYQKSMRSAKYAIMFIVLTFIMFFLFELINKKRTHPIQYILVSAGLLIFYSLLLSLSEHIGFNLAYLISSVGIITLITFYSHSIFRKFSVTVIMGVSLSVLYGFLFVILQLQDYSLLLGSIGLFIILAVIMFISRKIDWYGGFTIKEN